MKKIAIEAYASFKKVQKTLCLQKLYYLWRKAVFNIQYTNNKKNKIDKQTLQNNNVHAKN